MSNPNDSMIDSFISAGDTTTTSGSESLLKPLLGRRTEHKIKKGPAPQSPSPASDLVDLKPNTKDPIDPKDPQYIGYKATIPEKCCRIVGLMFIVFPIFGFSLIMLLETMWYMDEEYGNEVLNVTIKRVARIYANKTSIHQKQYEEVHCLVSTIQNILLWSTTFLIATICLLYNRIVDSCEHKAFLGKNADSMVEAASNDIKMTSIVVMPTSGKPLVETVPICPNAEAQSEPTMSSGELSPNFSSSSDNFRLIKRTYRQSECTIDDANSIRSEENLLENGLIAQNVAADVHFSH